MTSEHPKGNEKIEVNAGLLKRDLRRLFGTPLRMAKEGCGEERKIACAVEL
jgi:hypothetical protein